jgi:hypothetical protein
MKTEFILFEMRKPVRAPQWWEGHTIHYKEYPVPGGIGLPTVNLSARDGGKQKAPPYLVGQPITVNIGGKKLQGEVYRIDVHVPGFDRPDFNYNPKDAEWKVTVCFPRIPKNHLKV